MIFCLGGAFNPPTIAHKKIAHTVLASYPDSRFVFLPVGDVYEKPMVKAHHRFAMVEAMIAGEKNIEADDLELQDTEYKGAIHSLERLEKKYGQPVVFVLGMDQAITLLSWKKAAQLLTHYRFLVIRRPGVDDGALDAIKAHYPGAIYGILEVDEAVSSTAYRTHKDASLVDPNVHQYILEHHLYKETSWPD